ncbi:hypothetical protein ACE6H2_017700 [Prunus campanulata]
MIWRWVTKQDQVAMMRGGGAGKRSIRQRPSPSPLQFLIVKETTWLADIFMLEHSAS